MTDVYKGWLSFKRGEEDYESLYLDDTPIAEALSEMSERIVTVRYYISNKEATEEELQEDFLINTLYGDLTSEYGAAYSEYTGYLWTDDELKIGGHDLKEELETYEGKYLYLLVDIDEKGEEEREKERAEYMAQYNYTRSIWSLASYGRAINKSLDEIVQDLKEYYEKIYS